VRPHILERDNFKCVKCGSTENITIHHKVEISQGGSDSEDNLITLCYKCHAFEHRNESIYKAMKVKIQE
jgi:5-methylcytosine-specific restriction endonuclease McrA